MIYLLLVFAFHCVQFEWHLSHEIFICFCVSSNLLYRMIFFFQHISFSIYFDIAYRLTNQQMIPSLSKVSYVENIWIFLGFLGTEDLFCSSILLLDFPPWISDVDIYFIYFIYCMKKCMPFSDSFLIKIFF